MRNHRVLAAGTLVLALGLLIASVVFVATGRDGDGWQMTRFGPGVMGYASTSGGSPVGDIGQARERAGRFGDRLGLRVGEVMQFSNNYYAQLVDGEGRPATEVLVNPRTGATWLEYGPAMMWNTRYGMMSGAQFGRAAGMMSGVGGMMGGVMGSVTGGPGTSGALAAPDATWPPGTSGRRVSAADARRIADRWLARSRSGLTSAEPAAFPGYFTLDVMRDGRAVGMLSVNAASGAVWPHWWHDRYVRTTG